MVTWYWATEYMKVLAGYIFVMFIWPSVVLRRFLKGRSTTFWFAFCATFQPILIYVVVIVLGLFHLLNVWLIRGLFFIPFAIEVIKWLHWGKKEARNIKHLLSGTYGVKLFCHNVLRGIGRRIGGFLDMLRGRLHGHWWECGLLFAVIIYGMIYFSYGVFQNYTFGASDMYVHNAWIYGLVNGKIFSAGVYPEGMHCLIYSMHVLFGIRIYSCLLFLQPVHVAVFMLSVVVFLREIFHWKYTPMFVLIAFLTIDVVQANAVISMSRLQWTLPQEFGFHSIFLCAAFLVRYLCSQKRRAFRGRLTNGYWDENLLVFALSLSASLTIHFYPTIMMFFVCLGFVPVSFCRIFSGKRFVPLVTMAALGFAVAVIPLAAARATGIPFEGSINWAMSVIRGSDGETEEETQQEETQQDNQPQEEPGTVSGQSTLPGTATIVSDQETGLQESDSTENETGNVGESVEASGEPLQVRLWNLFHRLGDVFKEKCGIIYQAGYVGLFGEKRAGIIICFGLLSVALWLCYRIPAGFLKLLLRRKKRKPRPGYFDQYLSITLVQFIFIILYCAHELGLPTLIEDYRIASVGQLLVLAMMGVPFDMIFSCLRLVICEGVLKIMSTAVTGGIFALVVLTGNYHGYLCVMLTRFNGAALCTQSIIQTLPRESYTIVSPTDELYQMIQYGWHEELITFVNSVQEEDYRLPSEHVFLYVEKTPLLYAQYHLFSGPEWLAQEKYMAHFSPGGCSQSPDVIVSELNMEELSKGPEFFPSNSGTYSFLQARTMLESVAYLWCQEFARLYPGELQTYYEDAEFICYYFRQNPQSLYQLGILYQE